MFKKVLVVCLVLLPVLRISAQCNPGAVEGQTLPGIPTQLSNFYIIHSDNTFTDPDFTEPLWGGFFDVDVMGRNSTQIATQKAAAISFFNTRFGVDFSSGISVDVNGDLNNELITPDGKFLLQYFMTPDSYDNGTKPADFGQKVIFSGGETVPASGWQVREGYYKMTALVDGATIAGTYASSAEVQTAYPGATNLPVIFGTFAVFGEYRIVYASPCSGNIDLNYSSIRPTYPDVFSTSLGLPPTATFDYDVSFDPSNGRTGIARGTAKVKNISGNTYLSTIRIIIKMNS